MNVRKPVDYGTMYRELTASLTQNLLQMDEVYAIGKAISQRPEKGAAVAAAEFLQANFPDRTGFSPRNVRRIRDFICHGNICRSPMAEFVMKNLVKKAGLASQFHIESAATSREEIGNPVYPLARRKLEEHGINCSGHAARQLTSRDYDEYYLLIGMDSANLRDMHRICGGDYAGKMSLLMDHTARPGNVADPWYTGDFEATWRDVLEGCQGLLKEL